MQKLEFLEEIPIHIPNTLQQLLGRFQTVRDGLPELIKNAKDQYSRLGVTDRMDRVIVVLVSCEHRRISVLDFAGAKSEDFTLWRKWSDPYANRASVAYDIEGGHGNGGKGFMVRGSTEDSFFESCREGLRTKMGFSNAAEDKLFYPAFYVEDGKRVDSTKVKSLRKQLESVLDGLGANLAILPDAARAILDKRQAFSMVQVNGVRDWAARRSTVVRQMASAMPEEIMDHPQAALSIETCSVFFVIDGVRLSQTPLERSYPEAMPGFESLAAIPIPGQLKDPSTEEVIETAAGDAATHYLQLRTSRHSLRMTNNKPLNVIRVRNARNVVGNWSVADMHSRAESAFIFGELRVPTLGPEHQVGADRVALADTPLVRALHNWTAEHVADLAGRIQKAVAREHKPQDLDKANDSLRKMRDSMREFLEETTRGKFAGKGGKGDAENGDGPVEKTPKPSGTVVRQIVLEGGAQSIALAKGTTVPLLVRAYDLSPEGEKLVVKGAQLELQQDPPGMASLVGKRILSGDVVGRTAIWFRDRLSGVESNRVEVEIVQATGAEFQELPSRLLLQGEEVPLRIVFKTARGTRSDLLVEARADLVVDAEVDEPLMGRVDRYGVFTAGGHEGAATVRVRYGSNPGDTTTGILQIGPNRVLQPPKKGGNNGGDVPIILLCGADAPGMEQYPTDQRTIKSSEQWPTIIDYEPPFEPNIIFINPDSKESLQVRSGRGGRRGTAGIGTEIFLQFLALKCFEILKRLYVRQSVKDGATTELQFRQAFAEAEILCAPFVDRAFDIAHDLAAPAKDIE
jgi:hypothetical protein